MYSYAGNVLICDLENGIVDSVELEDDLLEETVGGYRLAEKLVELHGAEGPLVITTGPLTGTLVPGAALAVLTHVGGDGELLHAPLTHFLGSELKYAGFDALVLKGVAPSPVYLWIHDGLATLEAADDMWGLDTWATTDAIKSAKGDDVIQVLGIGAAGEETLVGAQVIANYWATADSFGFGRELGARRVKAIALRGLGMIDVEEPDALFDASLAMTSTLAPNSPMGLANVASRDSRDSALGDWLEPLIHRHRGCFACTSACFSFVKYNESPRQLRSDGVAEPGLLLTNISALVSLREAGFEAEAACRVLEAAVRQGIAPEAAAQIAVGGQSREASTVASGLLSGLRGADLAAGGSSTRPADARESLGYLLGVCPNQMRFAEDLTKDWLLEAVRLSSGMELDDTVLNGPSAGALGLGSTT